MNGTAKPPFLVSLLLCIGLAACAPIMPTAPTALPEANQSASLQAPGSDAFLPVTMGKSTESADDGLQGGVGIIGDSFYDEYQADDNRGGAYSGVTFNLVEILVHRRNFDIGPWGVWGEPRRSGYEYNWARSGATSSDMIAQGQHTGLAEQVRQGKVKYVLIGIGANDFNPYYGPDYPAIYNGHMSDEDLTKKIETAVANVTLAVDTVQKAGAEHIVVTVFTQFAKDPVIPKSYPDAAGRQRVADAVERVNQGIRAMGKAKGVVVLDQNALSDEILPSLEGNRYLNVGGERIDVIEVGDEPHHSRLADVQHLGTVVSGVSANLYFIETFNTNFGTSIVPLSDAEILKIAGLR